MSSYRYVYTRKRKSFSLVTLLVLTFLFTLCYRYFTQTSTVSEIAILNLYRRAEKLRINGSLDPPCEWSIGRCVYLCAGHCPWVPTKLVKCTFLPRILHTKFQQNGMYCTPPPDNCPTQNAWLKDRLPLVLNPVRTIPLELLSNFTLSGLISVNYSIGFAFSNYSGSGLNWSVNYVNGYRNQVKKREPFGTYKTSALYPVLEAYGEHTVRHKKCAVIGSEYPWVEAALLEFEAASVTTIEYNRITTDVPNLFTITPSEFAIKQQRDAVYRTSELFDSVWSYSSLEHDGLGRYTDPINPYGDFQTMIKISCMIKPGGFLILAVPLNKKDTIHFNLHRVYGPIRLPILYRYFHLVHVFGDEFPSNPNDYGWQPIAVLQNKIGCK